MAAAEQQQTISTENILKDGEFHQIKRKSRKRRIEESGSTRNEQMDTAESLPKRPMLPPISADKISVSRSIGHAVIVKY